MKRTAKKLFALALILSLLMSMVACGSKLKNSEYVGTWKGTTAEYSEIEMNVSDVVGDFTITFDKKGNCTFASDGTEQTGSWDETDTGVTIDDGAITMTKGDDGKLSLESDGVVIYFEKQTEE
jgi:hypothetical protein